jgi:hypothetical protein
VKLFKKGIFAMHKNERNITVCKVPGAKDYDKIPRILLQGRWLEALGFEIGQPITVSISENNKETILVIKHK